MARRIYVGPVDAIDTKLDGVEMTLKRGESVDVSDDTAKALDNCPDNWAKPKSASKTKEGE
jgi:hypothetical protein